MVAFIVQFVLQGCEKGSDQLTQASEVWGFFPPKGGRVKYTTGQKLNFISTSRIIFEVNSNFPCSLPTGH